MCEATFFHLLDHIFLFQQQKHKNIYYPVRSQGPDTFFITHIEIWFFNSDGPTHKWFYKCDLRLSVFVGREYVLYLKFIMTHFFHFMNRTNLLVCSKTKEKKDCEINVKYIISFVETKENIFFVCCLWLCYPHLVFIEYMCQISIFIFPKPHTKFTINIKYSTRAPPHTTHNTTHRTFEYKIWSRFWYFGTVTIFFIQKTWPHHTTHHNYFGTFSIFLTQKTWSVSLISKKLWEHFFKSCTFRYATPHTARIMVFWYRDHFLHSKNVTTPHTTIILVPSAFSSLKKRDRYHTTPHILRIYIMLIFSHVKGVSRFSS